MPNTLVHLGLQGVATHALLRRIDPKWVFLGAIIPDVPWMAQRAVLTLLPIVDPYQLRLYAVAQASLAGSLLLCAAGAALSAAPRLVFVILGLNSALHLLLDALQTKWANGVHLWAPFSWELWNVGWFWPENTATHVLTVVSVGCVATMLWRQRSAHGVTLRLTPARFGIAALLLAAYGLVPALAIRGPERADNHYVATLRDRATRPGKPVEFDRAQYRHEDGRELLITFARETLLVVGSPLGHSAVASVRATFRGERTISIREAHVHAAWARDLLSYLGLCVVAAVWLRAVRRERRQLQLPSA